MSRDIDTSGVAFRNVHNVGTLDFNRISRLNTRPARTPVNASAVTLLPPPHDSGPMWFAKPSSYDSFIHITLPVLTGAFVAALLTFENEMGTRDPCPAKLA
jgi:hypothetical protein